jgi:glycerate-2-kinase
LSAYEFALQDSSPRNLIERAFKVKDSVLTLTDLQGKTTVMRLDNFDSIYIVGAGKATGAMSSKISSILKNKLSGGAITIPRGLGNRNHIHSVEITEAGHPLPDKAGIKGSKKIVDVLRKTTRNDLVFCMISGGGSSLLPLPINAITLEDKRDMTKALLKVGASINEVNMVRKHLSLVKGGRLVRYVPIGCTVVTLIMSDVIGDPMGSIASGPTVPDDSTFRDAAKILKKYGLWRELGCPITEAIMKGMKGEIQETPKRGDPIFENVHNILIGNNATVCNSAVRYLKAHIGVVRNMGSSFSGEARDFGAYLAKLGKETITSKRPIAIVLGGETTVRLIDSEGIGIGGRNQEAILSAALKWKIPPDFDAALICMTTDGIDGNSRAGGAVLTSRTIGYIKRSKIQLESYLMTHNSYNALKRLKAVAITHKTGTNLNDITILCSMGGSTRSSRS